MECGNPTFVGVAFEKKVTPRLRVAVIRSTLDSFRDTMSHGQQSKTRPPP